MVAAPLRRRPTLGLGAGDQALGAGDRALGEERDGILRAAPGEEGLLTLSGAGELLLPTGGAPRWRESACTAADAGLSGGGSSLDPGSLGAGTLWPKI